MWTWARYLSSTSTAEFTPTAKHEEAQFHKALTQGAYETWRKVESQNGTKADVVVYKGVYDLKRRASLGLMMSRVNMEKGGSACYNCTTSSLPIGLSCVLSHGLGGSVNRYGRRTKQTDKAQMEMPVIYHLGMGREYNCPCFNLPSAGHI